jgi:NAD(P)H-hydrate epimerase
MNLYSVTQMREAERCAEIEYGIPLADLMDNAGKGLARAALEMLPQPEGVIGIFCGNGNNGGDGYVCATELLRFEKKVAVWAIGADQLPDGSLVWRAAEACKAAGGTIMPVSSELQANDVRCSLLVDALLGTGLTRPVSGLYAHAVALTNAVPAPVLSCDLPSGIDADTGRVMGTAVRADKTLMMGLGKLACALPPGDAYFGRLAVCDIGLPTALVARLEAAGREN